jgi:oligopeptide transport system permease protein
VIRYALARLAQSVPVLLAIATATFLLLRLLPGGPFDTEKTLPPEVRRNVEARYHLDEPLAAQYARYLAGTASGDLGPSYKYVGRDVSAILADAFPVSAQLGVLAFALALGIGVPLGLAAGVRRGRAFDRASMLLTALFVSVPGFALGASLVLAVALGLGLLPAALWEGPANALLPALTLAALPLAYVAQLTRAAVVDVIDRDFVRTARAKGVREREVRWRHVLRNALLPVVTYLGPLVAVLLTGSFVVEVIFAIPGMGRFFVTAVTNRDYPLVLGVTLVYGVLVVLANLGVDLLYAWLDPRIRLGGRRA